MTTSVKALFNSLGKNWGIGESRQQPWAVPTGTPAVVEREGMTLLYRGTAQTILASDYPEFYSKVQGYTGFSSAYWNARVTGSSKQVVAVEGEGTTVIAVTFGGGTGGINKSSNGGVTYTEKQSIIANIPHIYKRGASKYVAPYSATKAWISINDGDAFTDTTITGLTGFNAASTTLRSGFLGTTRIMADANNVWYTANDTAWSIPTGITGGGKLTFGNGYAVILQSDGKVYYTTTGITWTYSQQLTSISPYQWGVIWDGAHWFLGREYAAQIGGGSNDPTIGTGYPTSGSGPSSGGPVYEWSNMYRSNGGVPTSFASNYGTYTVTGCYGNGGYWWWNGGYNGFRIGMPSSEGWSLAYQGSSNGGGYYLYCKTFVASPFDVVFATGWIGNQTPTTVTSLETYFLASVQSTANYYYGTLLTGQIWSAYKEGQGPIAAGSLYITGAGSVPSLLVPVKTNGSNDSEGPVFTRLK